MVQTMGVSDKMKHVSAIKCHERGSSGRHGGFFLENGKRGKIYVAEFHDETRMTSLLSQVHSLSKIEHRAANFFFPKRDPLPKGSGNYVHTFFSLD